MSNVNKTLSSTNFINMSSAKDKIRVLAKENSSWKNWTASGNASDVQILLIKKGETIYVGNDANQLQPRLVKETFVVITSKLLRNSKFYQNRYDVSMFACVLRRGFNISFPDYISIDKVVNYDNNVCEFVITTVLQLAIDNDKKRRELKKFKSINISGKSFVLTGTGPKTREKIFQDIEHAGGTVQHTITNKTDYLVCADITAKTNKIKSALSKKIKIISYEQLMEQLT